MVIPSYLEAKTKDKLRELMFNVQKVYRMNIHFFDFQFVAGKWVCWYEVEHSFEKEAQLDGKKES